MTNGDEFAELQKNVREMREALTVNSRMALEHERQLKDHAGWLEEHERTMAAIDKKLDRLAERDEITDQRIQALVSAIGELVRRKGE